MHTYEYLLNNIDVWLSELTDKDISQSFIYFAVET